jgi:hypothetical protein
MPTHSRAALGQRRSWTAAVLIAALLVLGVQQPASAANPHFVHASATLNEPVTFTDPDLGDVLFWAAEATLDFQLAGLGRNDEVTVVADAALRFAAALATCPDGGTVLAFAAVIVLGDSTLTSTANGVVKGQIVLRQVFAAAATSPPPSPDGCGQGVRVAYGGISLTVEGTGAHADLGSVSGTFVRGSVDESEIPPLPDLP